MSLQRSEVISVTAMEISACFVIGQDMKTSMTHMSRKRISRTRRRCSQHTKRSTNLPDVTEVATPMNIRARFPFQIHKHKNTSSSKADAQINAEAEIYWRETRHIDRTQVQTNSRHIHKQRLRNISSEPKGAISDNGICVAPPTIELYTQAESSCNPYSKPHASSYFPFQTLPNNPSYNGRSTRRQRSQLLRSRLAELPHGYRFDIKQPLRLVPFSSFEGHLPVIDICRTCYIYAISHFDVVQVNAISARATVRDPAAIALAGLAQFAGWSMRSVIRCSKT